MRILFLDTYPVRRGAQVFISDLAQSITDREHECMILYLYSEVGIGTRLYTSINSLCLEGNPSNFQEKIPSFQFKLLFRALTQIKKFNPDVILLNGSRTLKYGAILKRLTGSNFKWVYRVIDDATYWNSQKLSKLIYKYWVTTAFDGAVAVSQSSQNAMMKQYSFSRPSTVIHRVFDPKKFLGKNTREEARQILGISPKDETLLFVGNITRQKRLDRFIEICLKVKETRPNLKALIVGDGPEKYKFNAFFELNDWLLFMGYQADVSLYYAASDLLILSSDTEGLPGVVLEAAYFKIPCVSARVGGVEECIVNNKTGYLENKNNINGFVEKVNFLLDNPEIRKEFGNQANHLLKNKFDLQKATNEYLIFFNIIAGQS